MPTTSATGLGLAIARVDRSGEHPSVMLTARVDADARADLFAEGPGSDWVLPLPEILDTTGSERRFRLVLDGVRVASNRSAIR